MGEVKSYHRQQHYVQRDRLPMWVIYNPTTKDFAGQWVARMDLSLPEPEPTDLVIVAATIGGVRGQLPEGLTNIGRQPGDDPAIAEVWL